MSVNSGTTGTKDEAEKLADFGTKNFLYNVLVKLSMSKPKAEAKSKLFEMLNIFIVECINEEQDLQTRAFLTGKLIEPLLQLIAAKKLEYESHLAEYPELKDRVSYLEQLYEIIKTGDF